MFGNKEKKQRNRLLKKLDKQTAKAVKADQVVITVKIGYKKSFLAEFAAMTTAFPDEDEITNVNNTMYGLGYQLLSRVEDTHKGFFGGTLRESSTVLTFQRQ